MLYLALLLIAIAALVIAYARKQMRESEFGGQAARLSRAEALAEYDRCKARLAYMIAGGERRGIDRLAERGAWMMDRVRGLEGEQTGSVQRIRHKMKLMEAARRDALCGPERRDGQR